MNETLNYKGFLGSIEISIEDDCLHGKLLFVEDLVTYEAETLQQLKNEFEAAVDDYLETCAEIGREPHKPFSGTFNVRIGPELHQKAARYAVMHGTRMNDVVKNALREHIETEKNNNVIHTHIHTYEYRDRIDLTQFGESIYKIIRSENVREKQWEKSTSSRQLH